MADKKIENDKTETIEISTETVQPKQPEAVATHNKMNRRGLIIGLVILAVLAVGMLGAAGYVAVMARYNNNHMQAPGMIGGSPYGTRSGGGFGHGRSVHTEINGDSVTTTVYNYVTGVVVAVNSDNIVIAGGGKQTTIKTNGSTTFVGSVKPKVNDTVTIVGTTADSVTTATQIQVLN